jgi:hypothetical protein
MVVLVGLLGVYAIMGVTIPVGSSFAREPFIGNGVMLESIAQLSPMLNFMSEEDGVFVPVPGNISWRTSRVRASLAVKSGDEDETIAAPYDLDFHGEYHLIMPDSRLNTVEVIFPFPQNLETLHNVEFLVDGEEPENVEYSTGGIRWQDEFISNEEHTISIRYRAEGAYTFSYDLPNEQRTDVDVQITLTGITGSSVPESSLPPMEIKSGDESETIAWEYSNLIDNRNIQINLPIEPSFSQRIAEIQFELYDLINSAPIIVIATLVALAVTLYLGGTRLKVESYLLLGLGLVLFFPMVTFLSGLMGVPAGSLIALLITIGLLVIFLRQTVGWDQIGWRTVLVLVVFLGIFGLGRLTEWSGLLLTSGSVLLLGIFMVLYARWQKDRPVLEQVQVLEETEEAKQPEEIAPPPLPETDFISEPTLHCPQCSYGLEEGVNYCPNCGYETKHIRRCGNCGREQFPPADFEVAYCLGCGEVLS